MVYNSHFELEVIQYGKNYWLGIKNMMLYQERVEFILQQLQLQSTVKVVELSHLLDVSVDTIRRDLKSMENNGLVRCVRGGACLPEVVASFQNFTGREIVNSDLKMEAARKAISLIKEGDVVAINSGTTNTILAKEMLTVDKQITVVTNNHAAVSILMQNPFVHIIAVGGDIDPLERSTYGTVCENEFGQYYPDIAFLSINAVNSTDGFTDFRFNEIGIIQLLAQTSKQVIAVMDSSKLGKCSKRKVLSRSQVDFLVMDNHVSENTKDKYSKKGIQII